MNTYSGRAVMLGEDGTELPVTVNLREYRDGLHTSWGGTITPALGSLKRLSNLREGRLRLPDGKEAVFLRPDTSDWAFTNRLTINGQDEPPF